MTRYRVPLGFVCAAVALVFVQPTLTSWWRGLMVCTLGELLRVWAAGHLQKGSEITRSGPYRFLRHPLYMGSTLLGIGFAVASNSLPVAILTVAYLSTTLFLAMRSEEAALDAKFAGAYSDYRAGRAKPVERPFSWRRVAANHEYRAVLGLIAVFTFLAWRI